MRKLYVFLCFIIQNSGFILQFHIIIRTSHTVTLGVILFQVSEMKKIRKKKRKHIDKESGVSRGIDFHHVANVINFDFPTSVNSYIHRVGRY